MKDTSTIVEFFDKEEQCFENLVIYEDDMALPAIHNSNGDFYCALYASTSDQKYAAYISKNHMDQETQDFMDDNAFTVMNCHCDRKECNEYYLTIRSQHEFNPSMKAVHLTKKITDIFPKDPCFRSVYFLSVSHDGKYICISSFDRSVNGEYCVIYEIKEDKILKADKLSIMDKTSGLGVFMYDGRFAIVNQQYLYLFSNSFKLQKCFSIESFYRIIQRNFTLHMVEEVDDELNWAALYTRGQPLQYDALDDLLAFRYMTKRIKRGFLLGFDSEGWPQSYVIKDSIRLITAGEKVEAVSRTSSLYAISESKGEWLIRTTDKNSSAYTLCSSQYRETSSYCLGSAEFSPCERYFTYSAMVADSGITCFYSVYFEVWDIFQNMSIYCQTKKLKESIPAEQYTQGLRTPSIIFEEQDQSSSILPKMIATYTAVEQGLVCLHSFDIEFERQVPLERITYALDKKVQSHLHEPIGAARYFEERELKGLNQIFVTESLDNLQFTVHVSNLHELYYSFKMKDQLYCIVIRDSVLEVWTRRSIRGTKYENLSKRKRDLMDQSFGDVCFDSEMIFVKDFKFPRGCLDTDGQPVFSIKNFERLVGSDELPTLEELSKSIQVLHCGFNNKIVFRLNLTSSESERIEDIQIPMIFLAGQQKLTFDQEQYHGNIFENACEALKYFGDSIYAAFYDQEFEYSNYDNIVHLSKRKGRERQIMRMIDKSFDYLKGIDSGYFKWLRGSDTLSLLASFEEGRKILFRIIQTKNLPVSLYTRMMPDKNRDNEAIGTSALTILIDALDFTLYKLLLNRIIEDAPKVQGSPISFCVTDALVLLQQQGNKDLLSKTMSSLDFLPLESSFTLCIIDDDPSKAIDFFAEQAMIQDPDEFRSTFMHTEQIKAENVYYNKLKTSCSSITRMLSIDFKNLSPFKKRTIRGPSKKSTSNYLKFCSIPLAYFSSYQNINSDIRPPSRLAESYKESSLFISMSNNYEKYNMYDEGNLIISLMLSHKWNQFVKRRFIAVYLIHLLFYVTYFFVVPFASDQFGFVPGESSISDNGAHVACTVLLISSGALLVFQEVRQYLSSPKQYFLSLYNSVDILLLTLTLFTFIQAVYNVRFQEEVQSICTLIVWLHALLRLRAFMYYGVALEVVIRLLQKVFQIILFMILVVFAFTHAFIVLLRKKDDSYFEEKYQGEITTSVNGVDTTNTVTYVDGGSNDFNNIFKSFKDVWFFIYGIWDPINSGDSADNVMAMLLSIVFSFLVLLLFFNVVIGFMSSSIEEVLQRGRKAWLNHFRDVIVEIEQFWCSNSERRSHQNNPIYLYYVATENEIKTQRNTLRAETEELIEEYKAMLP